MKINNFKRSNYNVIEVSSEDNESESAPLKSLQESEHSSPEHLIESDDDDDDILTM